VNHRDGRAGTCRAIERARAAGLRVGCNAFLTTASLPQMDELTVTVGSAGRRGTCFGTASYLPAPRSRRNERLRLALPELLPVAARLAELVGPVSRCLWTSWKTRRRPAT
jgi:hypothetical protein